VRQRRASVADKAAASRFKSLARAASQLSDWKPAHSVLTEVRAVPTIFPLLDAVSGVGGWPTDRFTLLHGPSNEGKTELLLGLGKSFLARGHFFNLIDAELTTPFSWTKQLLGAEADSPGFVAIRFGSFEYIRGAVRRFCDKIGELREAGEIDPDTSALIALDSIRKLVPEKIWDELTKEAEGKAKRGPGGKAQPRGVDGYGGRAAQYKAALNAAWLDELIPLLAQTGVGMITITRETPDPDDDFDREVRLGGGKALFFDSSFVVRTTKERDLVDGEGKDATLVGERRCVAVYKTKIAGRTVRWPEAFYHSSNGRLAGVPAGFDRPRDLLELALQRGVCEAKGSWIAFDGANVGQGANRTVRRLHAEPSLLARLEAAVLERPAPVPAVIEEPAPA
jgi:RecA/RadA recombinase